MILNLYISVYNRGDFEGNGLYDNLHDTYLVHRPIYEEFACFEVGKPKYYFSDIFPLPDMKLLKKIIFD